MPVRRFLPVVISKPCSSAKARFAGSAAHVADGYRRGIHQIVKSLWGLEVPAIAAVNGPAIGLGNDVACLCDMRIAADDAIMGATFLKVGLIPGDGGAWLLRVLSVMRAPASYCLPARQFQRPRLWSGVLCRKWFRVTNSMQTAQAMAEEVVKQGPEALRAAKRLLRHGQNVGFETLMEMSANAQALMHVSDDHHKAVSAMLEKRSAEYQDK